MEDDDNLTKLFYYQNILHTIDVSNVVMAKVTSHATINVSRTNDQNYICWVNDTKHTLNTSSIEATGLTPDTMYSIGCVEVDEVERYQCTEYNTTVVTGEYV